MGNKFELNDVGRPMLFREQFPYESVPRVLFDHTLVLPSPPDDIWITDTTFRDGQQARPPYKPAQIVALYDMLHRLGGPKGVIRQCEFFLYSQKDQEAVRGCLEKGYAFPEVTGWIRANKEDFKLVKQFGLKETGILTSVSDYHIFLKLKKSRRKAMEDYLDVVRASLDEGIIPRCHFEDITRADIHGFCLPFAGELLKLSQQYGMPVKVRLCDTMGFGVSLPGAVLPRSVPRLAHAFVKELGYPSEHLEWHGHNDFHKVMINGMTAWRHGISALNASLLGFGERTGNPPLEGAIVDYLSLVDDHDGIDTTVITEIAEYFRHEIDADIPPSYPFVGSDFNTTRAGIHADGLLKNPEIYNVFNTEKLLKRRLKVIVTDKSGMAGIARWINENVESILSGASEPITKRHPGVKNIDEWVREQYAHGRTTGISPDELFAQTRHYIPSLFESDFSRALAAAEKIARKLALKISQSPKLAVLEETAMTPFLNEVIRREASIQLMTVTDINGRRISRMHTQRGEKALFRNLFSKDFDKKEWFIHVMEEKQPWFSDLFYSKFTGELTITAAIPLLDETGAIRAILDIDFKFDQLVKLISRIPEDVI